MRTMSPCTPVDLDFVESAPVRFNNSVELVWTPEQLFDFLSRGDTWPLWAKVITNVEYTSPEPYGAGTTRRVTMRAGLVGDEEFLAWEPGRRLSFRFNASSTKAVTAFIEDYLIEPTATGSRLTWKLGQEMRGPAAVFNPISRRISDAMFRRFLRNLQRLASLEAGQPGIPGRHALRRGL